MKTIVLNRFDGGMAESRYAHENGACSVCRNFDILTSPGRLVPRRALSADTSGQYDIGNLLAGSDGLWYGLGSNSGSGSAVFKKASSVASWSSLGNSTTGTTPNYSLFVEYKGNFYYAIGGATLMIIPTGGVAANSSHSLSYTNICQGVVHPKDDCLYIGYDNKIAVNNAGSWTDTGLTLPSYLRVTALAPYGNYLAIAVTPTTEGGTGGGSFRSIVYLWDRDTSLATVSESIDWGTGNLSYLNTLDNVLIGISDTGGSGTNIADNDSIQIKGYSGGTPVLIKEFSTQKQTTTTPNAQINPRVNFVFRNRLYFSIDLVGGGSSPAEYGIWSIGKSKLTGRLAVSIEYTNFNGSALAAAIVGDYMAAVNGTAGTTVFSTTSSSLTAAYTTSSSIETCINPNMDSVDNVRNKQLNTLAIFFDPLLSGQQASVYYRVDSNLTSAWTLVGTASTTGQCALELAMDNAGTAFTSGRSYEFKIMSANGAVITGVAYKYENLDTLI